VIVLAYIFVDRAGRTMRIIIVPNCNDKIWIPAFYKIRNIRFVLTRQPVISNNCKADVFCL